MKKSVLLLAAMYAYLLVPVGMTYFENTFAGESVAFARLTLALRVACMLFLLIAGACAAVSAGRLLRSRNYSLLRSEMKTAKLGSIPFFIAGFVVWFSTAMLSSLLGLFFFWTFTAPILTVIWLTAPALILYGATLASSAYGIAFLILLRKEGRMKPVVSILLLLLQLVPVADVVVTFVLLSKYRKT